MVEPFLWRVVRGDARHGVQSQTEERRRSAVFDSVVVVRADQQCVIGLRFVLMVLREVVHRGGFAGRVIAGAGKHWYVDLREPLPDGQPLLPEPVVARVIQPASENGAGPTRQRGKLAI